MQVQIVDHRLSAIHRLRAVRKTDMLEQDFATRYPQRLCIRAVQYRAPARQCVDPVLHGADLLEQGGHLPHDPVRNAIQPQGHRGGRSDRAHAQLAAGP